MLIAEDLEVKGMYRLQWNDGVYSEDYYNITWAKEHLKRLENYEDDYYGL